MKRIISLILILILAFNLCGCREADIVNHNLSKEADFFNVERRITVYNCRTDKILLNIEGYMSLSNNSENELVVTCKTGANEYKKNYVILNNWVIYVVEDITGTHTDPYHYQVIFNPDAILPTIQSARSQ